MHRKCGLSAQQTEIAFKKKAMEPRILVSDDANITGLSHFSTLQKGGYQVSRAVDGEQCLELVRAKPPDFLILDLLIPKMLGLGVLK